MAVADRKENWLFQSEKEYSIRIDKPVLERCEVFMCPPFQRRTVQCI